MIRTKGYKKYSGEEPGFFHPYVYVTVHDARHVCAMARKIMEEMKTKLPSVTYSSETMSQEELLALVPSANGGSE